MNVHSLLNPEFEYTRVVEKRTEPFSRTPGRGTKKSPVIHFPLADKSREQNEAPPPRVRPWARAQLAHALGCLCLCILLVIAEGSCHQARDSSSLSRILGSSPSQCKLAYRDVVVRLQALTLLG
ncbi:hypothetical protein TNCV_2155521 [Trichonephila clavipes]|nr:hypothetical protein TNCV_2155521 [Trichonephila clavipes]